MQERIVEILMYVLSEARKNNKPVKDIDTSQLEQKGYTTAEINFAFSWLFDRLSSAADLSGGIEPVSPQSFRVLHNIEKLILSNEAYGYLIQLRELNIISDLELEAIIERSIMAGFDQIDVAGIQSVVAAVLFDADHSETNRGGMIIQSNNTIH